MKKGLIILGVAVTALATYFVIHSSITMEARAALSSECPELVWLKREYQLSDEKFEKIQTLHNNHDVECRKHCKALASTQQQLQEVIVSQPLESEAVRTALKNWRDQQVISQDAILKHMVDVSKEMEPEHARRYRENVYRSLILSGQNPHINSNGEYNSEFILHLKD